MTEKCDVLIVGSGPAGLAAANYCLNEGISFLVIESGKHENNRSHEEPAEVVKGVGGAGLFSDGKISYYPSGHAIYSLPSSILLKKAFNWFHNLFSDILKDAPVFPENIMPDQWSYEKLNENFFEKKYESIYLTQNQLKEVTKRLSQNVRHKIITNSSVRSIEKTNEEYVSFISKDEGEVKITARGVIYCGGRFGPIGLKEIYKKTPMIFRRLEYGVRIQQKKEKFFLSKFPTVDTKIVSTDRDGKTQWKTFCCCKEGIVLQTNYDGLSTFSGSQWRSDKSNVGLNIKIRNHDDFVNLKDEVENLLSGKIGVFNASYKEFMEADDLMGEGLTERIQIGLKKLSLNFPIEESEIIGPCIEGVGMYPDITAEMELKGNRNFYIAGDSTGIFRGILTALLSGYYVAEKICKSSGFIDQVHNSNQNVKINHSSIDHMPVIFTAQSKKFFYCKDVICEFVLKKGCLPINPFQVFSYFLGDRVDRDIIRKGNNNLINLCDELWVFGPIADGVLFEIIYSLNIGRPVKFFKVGTRIDKIELIKNIKDISFEQEIHLAGHKKDDLLKEIELALSQISYKNMQVEMFP